MLEENSKIKDANTDLQYLEPNKDLPKLKIQEDFLRDNSELINSLIKADIAVMKKYLPSISNLDIVPLSDELKNKDVSDYIRFYKINKLVFENNENNQIKLSSLYQAIYNTNSSVITIIESNENEINLYIGIKNIDDINSTASANSILNSSKEVLKNSITGIFSGTELSNVDNDKIKHTLNNISRDCNIISSCSSIAGVKKIDIEDDNNSFTQGIEKLIDAMRGEKYSIVIISDPIMQNEISAIKSGYESIYSQLSPFRTTQLSYSTNESESVTKTITEGISHSISRSISDTETKSKTTTFSVGKTFGNSTTNSVTNSQFNSQSAGENTSESISNTESVTNTDSYTKTDSYSVGASVGGGIPGIGGSISGSKGWSTSNAKAFAVGTAKTIGTIVGKTLLSTVGTSVATTVANTVFSSINMGLARSYGTAKSHTIGRSDTDTKSSDTSEGTSKTTGNDKSLQITSENKMVTNILDKLDSQLERLNECADVGVWNSAAYFITDDVQTNRVVSSMYQSLIRGEGSSVETGAINLWNEENRNRTEVLNYISKMYHPMFHIDDTMPNFSPAVTISSMELAIQAGLPQKSVAGLPVIKYTPFAREIVSYDDIDDVNSINIGKIFHFGKEENREVNLDLQSLASHTFITGSTGSGKSNTIYNIISKFIRKNIKFMVIEPAKGEYKNVFGHRKDVHVFGTNPYYTELLRINPFSFNKSIHVLEHIDRLIDIFNVCWPMYAAMPAVLKEAVEKSYIDTGWDLDMSVNKYGDNIFPNFIDVLNNLKKVIESSDYSQEVKSNYTGSLVTRVKSLTNGIIGRIFSSKEIDEKILFDENVIVDLSRVGSLETKSMIMGILIMNLSEYRTSSQAMNQNLKHVAILEEAHNILKRTSTEQVSESANLVGKSVEMLSNSIAEMRTYGEGFIIADQSPSAVDMSAIRNTNTKIILRLPEYSDREMVGKAAGLNDDKIEELAKLHTGVAAVYQNNWIDSVLCKVEHYNIIEEGKSYKIEDKKFIENKSSKGNILKCLVQKSLNENIDTNIISSLNDVNIAESVKINIREVFNSERIDNLKLSSAVYDILNGSDLLAVNKYYTNCEIWHSNIIRDIENTYNDLDSKYALEGMNLMLKHAISIGVFRVNVYNDWVEQFYRGGTVL
ncbi:ATP-binding protein [uncultured Brachyspira sp.]|uniref:ATP-binding protein n=1 Tax=uncultured Brachyspira sp. TaxID=221953 RepID=UPI0026033D55|nr:ATP-binding protein [uncultured Brachyspira sp.]